VAWLLVVTDTSAQSKSHDIQSAKPENYKLAMHNTMLNGVLLVRPSGTSL